MAVFACAVRAQANLVRDPIANTDAPRADAPEFDVVSIKPGMPGIANSSIVLRRDGDEYHARNFPLWFTIGLAYLPYALIRPTLLQGAPGWVWHDQYDFEAKVRAADVKEWQKQLRYDNPLTNPTARDPMLQAMLQKALADRCHLVVHRTPTEVPGYALVVGKHGPNWKELREPKPDEPIPSPALKLGDGAIMIPILSPDQPVLHFFRTSMALFVQELSRRTPVEDRTGLTGRYDFDLMRVSTEGDAGMDWNVGALGLRLVPIKVPGEAIVIDHIEPPTPN